MYKKKMLDKVIALLSKDHPLLNKPLMRLLVNGIGPETAAATLAEASGEHGLRRRRHLLALLMNQ